MIANYHTHTPRCGHAWGREEEYVRCALERGLDILGFSDHSPYPFPDGYRSTFRMELHELDDYIDAVLTMRKQFGDQIRIHLGLELEYYPMFFSELLAILRDRPVEYLLLGQHCLGSEIDDVYSGRPTDDEALLQRYCHQVMDAMNTGVFTYLAHPDLFRFTGDRRTYGRNMRLLCREAKQCGLPLEINMLGLAEGRNYPNPLFWEVAAEEGCTAVVGCDAHRPEALLDLETEKKARALAETYGIRLLETIPLHTI